MEFIDLKAQYAKLKPEMDAAIQAVLNKSNYISGEEVELLEKELAEYVGAKYCVTCANGTDALVLALKTMDIGEGDAVFVPNYTFFATPESVSLVGAVPVFVDIDENTFNIDPVKLDAAIKNIQRENKLKPKAIIPVDLFGLLYDVTAIAKIARDNNLLILEDGAQGFGGEYNRKKACSFGDISITSFFPAKPLGCYGDGGAIFTNSGEYYKTLLSLRVHGKGKDKYDNIRIGTNSRLDTIQAAVLQVKLKAFKDYELTKRHEVAALYDKYLSGKVKIPTIPKNYTSSYAQYTVTFKDEKTRNKVEQTLKSNGIPTIIYYHKTMHQQTAYQASPCKFYDVSVSESLTKKVLCLPMHPYLDEATIKKICETVMKGMGA